MSYCCRCHCLLHRVGWGEDRETNTKAKAKDFPDIVFKRCDCNALLKRKNCCKEDDDGDHKLVFSKVENFLLHYADTDSQCISVKQFFQT